MGDASFQRSDGEKRNLGPQPEGSWRDLNCQVAREAGGGWLKINDDVAEKNNISQNRHRENSLSSSVTSSQTSASEHSPASSSSSFSMSSVAGRGSKVGSSWPFSAGLASFSPEEDVAFSQSPLSRSPQSTASLTSLSTARSDESSDTCLTGSEVTGLSPLEPVVPDAVRVRSVFPACGGGAADGMDSGLGGALLMEPYHAETCENGFPILVCHIPGSAVWHRQPCEESLSTDGRLEGSAGELPLTGSRRDERLLAVSGRGADMDVSVTACQRDMDVSVTVCGAAPPVRRNKKRILSEAPEAKGDLKLPPCRICAQPASGFHYGVNSCEACKGFFQRCLTRKLPYKCKGGEGRCAVPRGLKPACAYCRYQKCLSVGMSKDAIRIGRYTHETRTQNTLEVRMLTAHEPPLLMSEEEAEVMIAQLMEARKCEGKLSAEMDEEFLERKWAEVQENYRLHEAVFGTMETLDAKEVEEVYRLTGLDVDNRKAQMERLAGRIEKKVLKMIQFAKGIPGFRELACQDQISLLKGGRVEFAFLTMYHGFSKQHAAFVTPCGKGVHKRQFEKLYGKEYTEWQFHIAESLKRLRLNNDELVLLQSILLTSADRCVLDNRRQVEELRWTLIRCLLRCLHRRQEDSVMTRFAQIVDQMTALRTLSEMAVKIFSSPAFLDILKKKPVLVEMILQ